MNDIYPFLYWTVGGALVLLAILTFSYCWKQYNNKCKL